MIDKVQKIKDWISKEQDGLMDAQGNFKYPEHEGASHILCKLDAYIDSLQEEPKFKTGDRIKPVDSCLGAPRTILEVCDGWYVTNQGTLDFEFEDNWEAVEEPVSESLNTESMIESYKQRLIPQVNGMKNSPLIDMCLTSYKHGINETLDTLNLSNVQRTTKNCEDPASEGRDIFDNCLKSEEKFILPQKISGNINCENCQYSSACALGDIQACVIDKPISDDLEEASKKWLIPKLDKTYAIYGEAKMMELTRFDGYAMLDAIEFGAKWGRNQAMAEIQAQSMALAHGCPKESVSDEEEKACWKAREKYDAKISFSKYMFKAGAKWKEDQMMAKAIDARCFGFQGDALFSFKLPAGSYLVGSKVKVIIIKED